MNNQKKSRLNFVKYHVTFPIEIGDIINLTRNIKKVKSNFYIKCNKSLILCNFVPLKTFKNVRTSKNFCR